MSNSLTLLARTDMKTIATRVIVVAFALLISNACTPENTVSSDTEWLRVIPYQGDSQQVNLKTLEVEKDSVAAWTRTSLITQAERPDNVELPPGTQLLIRMHVSCRDNGASIRFIAAEFRSSERQLVHAVGAQSTEAVSFPPTDGFEYGQNTPGLICAAAAAKCANRSLQWPMPKIAHEKFLPSCK
jgi:hypothetical protein